MQTSSEAKSSPLEPMPRPTAKKLVTVQITWLRIYIKIANVMATHPLTTYLIEINVKIFRWKVSTKSLNRLTDSLAHIHVSSTLLGACLSWPCIWSIIEKHIIAKMNQVNVLYMTGMKSERKSVTKFLCQEYWVKSKEFAQKNAQNIKK